MSEQYVSDLKVDIADLSATFSSEIKHTRDDISAVRSEQKIHSDKLNNITQSISIIDSTVKNNKDEIDYKIGNHEERFGRDYQRLNDLEKRNSIANGVEAYKRESRGRIRYVLYVVGAILGLIITVNAVLGITKPLFTKEEVTRIEYKYLPAPDERSTKGEHGVEDTN